MLNQNEAINASRTIAARAGLPRLLTKRQLAEQLGVGVRTVEEFMYTRRVPVIRLSQKLVRFDLAKVVSALERFEIKPVSARRLGAAR